MVQLNDFLLVIQFFWFEMSLTQRQTDREDSPLIVSTVPSLDGSVVHSNNHLA